MKINRSLLATFAAIFSLCCLAVSVPVGALATTETGNNSNAPANGAQPDIEPNDNIDNNQLYVKDLNNKFKQNAEAALAQARSNIKMQTEASRQKVCEARQTALTNRMSTIVTKAKNHKATIDSIYTKVKQFHDNKNISLSNYDQLTEAADSAQTTAANNITALEAADVTIDCTSSTVADTVSTFQQAVKSTRDSLDAYRKAVVQLIEALKTASSSTTNSSNG